MKKDIVTGVRSKSPGFIIKERDDSKFPDSGDKTPAKPGSYYWLVPRCLLALAVCLLPLATFAQDDDRPAAERIESWKVAFITERLRLSPEEAQGFWPLYNQYEAEEKRLRQQYRPARPIIDMSDREAEQYLNGTLEMEGKIIELQRQYIRRFQSVISFRKIALLKQAEEDFKRELLRRLQEWRQQRKRN